MATWQICVYFFNDLLYLNGESALMKESTPKAIFSRQLEKFPLQLMCLNVSAQERDVEGEWFLLKG